MLLLLSAVSFQRWQPVLKSLELAHFPKAVMPHRSHQYHFENGLISRHMKRKNMVMDHGCAAHGLY